MVPALEGRDIIARAKTGTGKTLAFGIPIIKRLTEDDEERISPRYLRNKFYLYLYSIQLLLNNLNNMLYQISFLQRYLFSYKGVLNDFLEC